MKSRAPFREHKRTAYASSSLIGPALSDSVLFSTHINSVVVREGYLKKERERRLETVPRLIIIPGMSDNNFAQSDICNYFIDKNEKHLEEILFFLISFNFIIFII